MKYWKVCLICLNFILKFEFNGAQNSISKKMASGSNASISEFPYLVNIDTGDRKCGGSIISRNIILTAAHCFKRINLSDLQHVLTSFNINGKLHSPTIHLKSIIIRAGSNHRAKGGKKFEVEKIKPHPETGKDIAIVKLKTSINFGPNISPIPLVEEGEIIPEGTMGVTAGWGRLDNDITTTFLHSVELPIIGMETCKIITKQAENKKEIHSWNLCAGDFTKDACNGDGSPVVVNGRLAAVISWSFGCTDRENPVLLTNVAHFISWIKEAIDKVGGRPIE